MGKYKREENISYTLGTTLTIELLNSKPDIVRRVYISPKLDKGIGFTEITELCIINKVEIIETEKIFKILKAKNNCYIIGEFNKYDFVLEDDANHLVLVNPSNDGNLGTIMRSALGFNFKNIIIIKPAVDIFEPKVIRASMGAIFNLNIIYYDSFADYLKTISCYNLYPFMLKAQSKLKETEFKEPYSLIFGKEDSGLDNNYLSIGQSVIIPHEKMIDSLNLPIAVSITLYEVTKNKY